LPSNWVKVIKQTNIQNPFIINFVNHPLTDDLKPDDTNIVIVKDFKSYCEIILANSVENLSKMRKIKFTRNGIYGTTDLLSESFDIVINLTKSKQSVENFSFDELNNAYDGFIPIKRSKYNDIMKLLKYTEIPENAIFYSSLTSIGCDITSKTKGRVYEILENKTFDHCECTGKCMRSCYCKNSKKCCDENCKCVLSVCKNKV